MKCNEYDCILNLVDFLLLNAYSTKFKGLYQGKAGIVLCLFEMAKYMDNEKIEDFAFELLLESLTLTSKSKNIGFENGLSGIGFVLLYLIENRLIEANFEEIFAEQLSIIQSQLKEKDTFSEDDLLFVYFLELLAHSYLRKKNIDMVSKIMDDVGNSLENNLKIFESIESVGEKFEILKRLDKYFKVATICSNYHVKKSLISTYIELYKKAKVTCFWLTKYNLLQSIICEEDYFIFESMKDNTIKNIYSNVLTLAQRIDLLYLLNQADNRQYEKQIHLLERDLFDWDNPQYEKQIIQSIPPNCSIAGYGSGIARLLLYWIYKENKRNSRDCSRFKYLF